MATEDIGGPVESPELSSGSMLHRSNVGESVESREKRREREKAERDAARVRWNEQTAAREAARSVTEQERIAEKRAIWKSQEAQDFFTAKIPEVMSHTESAPDVYVRRVTVDIIQRKKPSSSEFFGGDFSIDEKKPYTLEELESWVEAIYEERGLGLSIEDSLREDEESFRAWMDSVIREYEFGEEGPALAGRESSFVGASGDADGIPVGDGGRRFFVIEPRAEGVEEQSSVVDGKPKITEEGVEIAARGLTLEEFVREFVDPAMRRVGADSSIDPDEVHEVRSDSYVVERVVSEPRVDLREPIFINVATSPAEAIFHGLLAECGLTKLEELSYLIQNELERRKSWLNTDEKIESAGVEKKRLNKVRVFWGPALDKFVILENSAELLSGVPEVAGDLMAQSARNDDEAYALGHMFLFGEQDPGEFPLIPQ